MPEQASFLPDQQVQCEVTGQWVPADETVFLQGKRVSAQGKQILLDQLRSGEDIPSEDVVPGGLRRFGCYFLDGIILWVIGRIVELAVSFGMTPEVAIILGLFQVVLGLGYYVVLHAKSGQTLGKKLGKLKVVNLDGTEISFWTSFIRTMTHQGVWIIIALFIVVIMLLSGWNDPSEPVLALIGISVLFGVVYSLADVVTVLVSKNKRAIHDMIAGTRVIQIPS